MPTATYSIQFTDHDGHTQTIKGVSDVKATEAHIKSIGGTNPVVVKGTQGSPDTSLSDTPTDPSFDPSQTAASTDAPDDSMQTSSDPAPKSKSKKGSVPSGLAKYLASKK